MLFKNRHAAFTQHLDTGFIVVHTDHLVAHLGKTYRGYESYIA
jgi:hypothetical protein